MMCSITQFACLTVSDQESSGSSFPALYALTSDNKEQERGWQNLIFSESTPVLIKHFYKTTYSNREIQFY